MSIPVDYSVETPLPPVTVEDWARESRARFRNRFLMGLVLAVLIGVSYVAFGLDSLALPVVVLTAFLVPFVLWHYPRVFFYLTYACVCLVELFPCEMPDSITDRIPFFWNVNTIFERYAHFNPKAMPFNLFELLAALTGVFALIRGVYAGKVPIKTGPLFPYIMIYIAFVTWGWLLGQATGGEFKVILMEVRAQFYLLLAYLLVVNTVNRREQVITLLWLGSICLVIKGAMYTYRQYITLGGQPLPDQGVGSHEEAFLFNTFVMLMMVLWLTGVHRQLQRFMFWTTPIVVMGNLATNRRAATASFVVVAPIMLLSAFVSIPKRRQLAAVLGIVLGVGGFAYYRAFKYSESSFAQPARAIRSQFEPSERDRSSNEYREAENANLMYNIRANPIGYGYGKAMVIVVPMVDISKAYGYWNIMPHNQILWIWMRVGWLGFIAFWVMVMGILVYTSQQLRRNDLVLEGKAMVLYVQLIVVMLIMFGNYDLQISNFRDMLFTGFWAGVGVAILEPGVIQYDPKADTIPRIESDSDNVLLKDRPRPETI